MQTIHVAQKEPEMTVTISSAPNAFPELLTELRWFPHNIQAVMVKIGKN